jgi:hypothetical protein
MPLLREAAMTDLTNINGRRLEVASQFESVLAFVEAPGFEQRVPDLAARDRYWSRLSLLAELLQNIDDTLADPNSVPQEAV